MINLWIINAHFCKTSGRMKRLLYIILYIALAVHASAQVKVTGRVIDLQNKPVSDVIVKQLRTVRLEFIPSAIYAYTVGYNRFKVFLTSQNL